MYRCVCKQNIGISKFTLYIHFEIYGIVLCFIGISLCYAALDHITSMDLVIISRYVVVYLSKYILL